MKCMNGCKELNRLFTLLIVKSACVAMGDTKAFFLFATSLPLLTVLTSLLQGDQSMDEKEVTSKVA